jgi:hypothetical protein
MVTHAESQLPQQRKRSILKNGSPSGQSRNKSIMFRIDTVVTIGGNDLSMTEGLP